MSYSSRILIVSYGLQAAAISYYMPLFHKHQDPRHYRTRGVVGLVVSASCSSPRNRGRSHRYCKRQQSMHLWQSCVLWHSPPPPGFAVRGGSQHTCPSASLAALSSRLGTAYWLLMFTPANPGLPHTFTCTVPSYPILAGRQLS